MGVVKLAVQAAMQGRNAAVEMFDRVQRIKDLNAQREEQERARAMSEAKFRLENNMKTASDLQWVKQYYDDPTQNGAMLAAINRDHEILGLQPYDKLPDPRDDAYNEAMFKVQSLAQKLGPGGEDLTIDYLKRTFGENYLTRKHLNVYNAQQIAESGQPKPEVVNTKNSPVASETPTQPVSMGMDNWESYFRNQYSQYSKSKIDIGEAVDLSKALADNPYGTIAALSITSDGDNTIKTLGSLHGLPNDLYSSNKPEYIKQLSMKSSETYNQKRADRNAPKLISILPKITDEIQSGVPANQVAAKLFPGMQKLGYEGTPEEFLEYVSSIPTTSPEKQAKILTNEENYLTDQIKDIYSYATNADEAEAKTRPLRERLWKNRVAQGVEKAGTLPKHYGTLPGIMKNKDAESLKLQGERFDLAKQSLELAQQRLELARQQAENGNQNAIDRLTIAQGQFELAQKKFQEVSGGNLNAGPMAKAAALNKDDKSSAQKLGFNTQAITYGPARVMKILGGYYNTDSPYWEGKIDKAYPEKRKLSAKGIAYRDKINREEKNASRKKKVSSATVTTDYSTTIDKKYAANQCNRYVVDNLKEKHGWKGSKASDVKNPKYGTPTDNVSNGTVVHLKPGRKGTTDHWAIVYRDKSGELYLNETINGKVSNHRPYDKEAYRVDGKWQPKISNSKQVANPKSKKSAKQIASSVEARIRNGG